MSRWYAARLGVELDTSGSDIGRLCFVSDDPALYLSPAYRPWLEGTGELPEGLAPLPLTWKEERVMDILSITNQDLFPFRGNGNESKTLS